EHSSQPLNRLRIFQLNLNKSQKAHLDLINGAIANGKLIFQHHWDILLIQEPYITALWPVLEHRMDFQVFHLKTDSSKTRNKYDQLHGLI
ncbi:hypothetical protein BYT27DRAFT_7281835, partial [Phlegmacium glaucopus]